MGRPIVIASMIGGVGLAQLLLSLSHWFTAVALVTLAGFLFVGAMIQLGTSILQGADNAHRGRVTSLQQIMFRIGQPVGALLAGLLAQRYGIGRAFELFGAALDHKCDRRANFIPADTANALRFQAKDFREG